MMLSEYLKPVLAVVGVAALAGGYYWIEHRSHAEEKETPGNALVIVTKSTNACFSDMVRVTGFFVPRREAVVGVDQEGSKVSELLVHEGDLVTGLGVVRGRDVASAEAGDAAGEIAVGVGDPDVEGAA